MSWSTTSLFPRLIPLYVRVTNLSTKLVHHHVDLVKPKLQLRLYVLN